MNPKEAMSHRNPKEFVHNTAHSDNTAQLPYIAGLSL